MSQHKEILSTIESSYDSKQTSCTVIFTSAHSPVHDEVMEYDVEIEYQVDDRILDDKSVTEYFRSIESTDDSIAHEDLAAYVHNDVSETVGSQTFVEVRCEDRGKNVWLNGTPE